MSALNAEVIGAAIEVHRHLGPGLLERAYREALTFELRDRRLKVETEVLQDVHYKGRIIKGGYRMDLLVEAQLVVELKTVERVTPLHLALQNSAFFFSHVAYSGHPCHKHPSM